MSWQGRIQRQDDYDGNQDKSLVLLYLWQVPWPAQPPQASLPRSPYRKQSQAAKLKKIVVEDQGRERERREKKERERRKREKQILNA